MGRRKTYVSATVTSLVTDSPNLLQQSVVSSIAHGTDIGQDIVSNLQSGIASTLTSYYYIGNNFRDTVDLFTTSIQTLYTTKILDVQALLEATHGSIEFVNFTVEPLNTDYLAYEYMASKYGYDALTDTFTSLPNGLPLATTVFNDSLLEEGTLLIEYINNVTGTVVYTETTSITGLDTDDEYYHVMFNKVGSDEILYWNYNTATEEYDYLTPSYFNFNDDYFPVIPLIKYGTNLIDGKDLSDNRFRVSTVLSNKLGLNLENISDSLKESESYNDIEQAHFVPSVRLKDNDQHSLKYLFNYWSIVQSRQKYTQTDFNNWANPETDDEDEEVEPKIHPAKNVEKFSMDTFKVDLSWLYMTKKTVNKTWTHGDVEYARYYQTKSQTISGFNNLVDTSTITYVRKISDTQQEELTIVGLCQTNYATNKYSVDWYTKDMFKTGEDDSDPVAIPVSVLLAQEVFPKLLDRNTFYYRTFNLVLVFKKTIKLKWYQTSFFQFVMIVIAIAITVYSAGALAESMTLAYTAAGGGAAGLVAAGSVALTVAFYSAITSFAMGVILEHYGWKVAAIVALVIMALSFNYSADTFAQFLPDATTLSRFVADVSKSFTEYFEDEVASAIGEATALKEEYTQWEEEYNVMMSEMFGLSDSFAEAYKQYTQDQAIYGRMTPSTFLFTAIDMPVLIPDIVLDAVTNYVDNALATTTEYDLI